MRPPGIAPSQQACRAPFARRSLRARLAFVGALLALLGGSGCQDPPPPSPAPAPPPGPTVATAARTVPVTNQMGQPIALFLLDQTTTTAPSGTATAVLAVRVQNVSRCTLSFPYTLAITTGRPGKLVTQTFSGAVTELPVDQVVTVHPAPAALSFDLRTAGLVITPHGEPLRTACPRVVGNWTGTYTLLAENRDDDWGYGATRRTEETGHLIVAVPAAGAPLEIRYVRLAGTRLPTDVSTSLVGTLSPDYEFTGQGLVRSSAGRVVDTVQATGVLGKLPEPDPGTGQPRLNVALRLKYANSPSDVVTLHGHVALH